MEPTLTELFITFHQDPGHGWIAITKAELVELNILDEISNYSYQSRDGKVAYLEEDLDAGTYLSAVKQLHPDLTINFIDSHSNGDSFIRSLPQITQ